MTKEDAWDIISEINTNIDDTDMTILINVLMDMIEKQEASHENHA